MTNFKPVKTIIVNLKHRTDRREHIIKEFEGRTEFETIIVNAITDTRGAKGLWQTLQYIIKEYTAEEEYIIVCEDDHRFTSHYDGELFPEIIAEAIQNGADVLSGGVSWLNSAVRVSPNIYWTDKFSGLQFTVIFKKAYSKILNAHFSETDVADFRICAVTTNKYFIYPFISNQKEFGYSDVTFKNNGWGKVDELFKKSEANISNLSAVAAFYSRIEKQPVSEDVIATVCISTYIIGTDSSSMEEYIKTNFANKPELIPVMLYTDNRQQGNDLLSVTLLKEVAAKAIANDEDVVIVCNEFHQFAPSFSTHYLIRNIMEAFEQRAEILFGGAQDVGLVVPVSQNRCWVGTVKTPHFMIMFRSACLKILEVEDDIIIDAGDNILSMCSSKMILYPFVSRGNQEAEQRLSVIRDRYEQQQIIN